MPNPPLSHDAFCIHGHFYQPPREDPFTHIIPNEPGAAPFHDWNQRICAECYRPNANLGNFELISFNIGPTLAMWMETYEPDTYNKIITQAKKVKAQTGIFNAIGQSFNHTILPLATREEKEIQVKWGIRDFVHRFGGKPEGMWLPETAVDTETLEVLAANGIHFTILAPWQVEQEPMQARHAYSVELPLNKSINVFFYNRALSDKISFDMAATASAEDFLQHSLKPELAALNRDGGFSFALAASDGEVYGHHHPNQQRFLSFLLKRELKKPGSPALVFPAQHLASQQSLPPIVIREETSWSCHHGILKWKDECGCTPNGTWKKPLRNAFDKVARLADEAYKESCSSHNLNYFDVLVEYIDVVKGLVPEDAFIQRFGSVLSSDDKVRFGLLLKAQYERHRMYTSCGWFFEDFDRIEPRNNVAYASAALAYIGKATGRDYVSDVYADFALVKSWRSGLTADVVLRGFMDMLITTR